MSDLEKLSAELAAANINYDNLLADHMIVERECHKLRAEVERLISGQHDVYAAAREEYRKKIEEQAAEIERLRAGLGDVHAAAGTNHLAARIARAALSGADAKEPTND